jgi:sugar (pentulose or hexulose) kinase
MEEAYFLGIDIGTQGARVILLSNRGDVIEEVEEIFPLTEDSREEQSPDAWWTSCYNSLNKLLKSASKSVDLQKIKAVSVTSTSGTVIPLDEFNKPLHNAIMYSDKRSVKQGDFCIATATKYHNKGYLGFNSSSGLAKMVWYQETYPAQAEKINKWIHAADYITAKLSNVWGVTDYTNAFKSGYDVSAFTWPNYISEHLGIKKETLPKVVSSGTIIGNIDADLAEELGLSNTVSVTAGITDGCASQIASGAMEPGEWNTTIGTTLVIKGVTKNEVLDPKNRIYSHRHPLGYWLPGGASNTGADWITEEFSADLTYLNEQASKLIPTGKIAFPLKQKGERFPILAPNAYGFFPEDLTVAEKFTAGMEGVAYLERYAYELIGYLANEKINMVYTAGGASKSDTWLKIRANVLNCSIIKMKHVSGAVGAAILAASHSYFNNIIEAVKALTQIEKEVKPDPILVQAYNNYYQDYLKSIVEKEFIKEDEIYG